LNALDVRLRSVVLGFCERYDLPGELRQGR
jgi:hypothetical protein